MRTHLIFLTLIVMAACTQRETPVVACAALVRGCALEHDQIMVRSDRAPSPLTPFVLAVTAPAAQEVYVELQMQGMDMGLNRYRLLRQANGEWRASITLPACVTGRRDWKMVVEVDGTRRALVFQAG